MHAIDHAHDLPRYSERAPTGFDPRGLNLPDRQNWRVLISRNRDSDILGESNWHTVVKLIEAADPDGEHHETHSFGHWACGWIEILIIDPDHDAAMAVAGEIVCALAGYPVLDEEDYSEREAEEADRYWSSLDTHERIRICDRNGVSIFAARRDEVPEGLPYNSDDW